MKVNKIWYLGIYPDVRNSKLNYRDHYLKHGIGEDRIPSPFLFSNSGSLNYKFSSCLYILLLLNGLSLNSQLMFRYLRRIICFLQYRQLKLFNIDTLVISPWLGGGVFESFKIYNEKLYTSKNLLLLRGIANTNKITETPMILTAFHFGVTKFSFLLFFPSEVINQLSQKIDNLPVHINHFFDLTFNFHQLLKNNSLKLVLFIHDYNLFSKFPHLYNEKLLIRLRLEDACKYFPNIDIDTETVISRINLFILPSKSVQHNLNILIPKSKQLVLYPPEETNIESSHVKRIESKDTFKILILGHLGNYKGLNLVSDVINLSHKMKAPYSFYHIGNEIKNMPVNIYANFSNVNRKEITGLISELEVDFAWLPFQCEETYSFTLSDIFRSHLPLISTNLGAIPERCLGRERTILLDPDLDARAILVAFQNFINFKEDNLLAGLSLHPTLNPEDLMILRKRDISTYQLLF